MSETSEELQAEVARLRDRQNWQVDVAETNAARMVADMAEAAIARVEALLEAEIADAMERSVRAAQGDVRCLDCNLRYDERQEYGCVTDGRGHDYDESDLAAAEQIERDTPVAYVTLSVEALRTAIQDPPIGGSS